MQVLLNEDKRAIGTVPDGIEWHYPDKRWEVIKVDDSMEWTDDYINYRWNGNKIIYEPKKYD